MGWSENVETPLRRVVHEWFTFSHFRLPGVRNYYRRLGYTLCRLDPGEVFHSLKDFGKGPLKIGKLVYDWRFPKEDPPTHGFQYHHFDKTSTYPAFMVAIYSVGWVYRHSYSWGSLPPLQLVVFGSCWHFPKNIRVDDPSTTVSKHTYARDPKVRKELRQTAKSW